MAVSRSSQNKPFTLRKNFENFEQHKDYPYVVRLATFFNKFPQIDRQSYFEAPFQIYKDEQFFDLKFYTSQRGIKAYSLYMKQRNDQDPDSQSQLDFIVKSLKFILKFCMFQKINLNEYLVHRLSATYSWTKHLKNYEVSIFVLHGFPNLQQVVNSIPDDEKQLLLGNVIDDFWKYKIRFYKSVKAKKLVAKGLEKIQKLLANKNKVDAKINTENNLEN